jgi:hypothetical protein
MEFRYTRHHVTRGTRADIVVANRLYLIKNVCVMHATYQVRLLAYRARLEGMTLVINLPAGCKIGPTLRRLRKALTGTIVLERAR